MASPPRLDLPRETPAQIICHVGPPIRPPILRSRYLAFRERQTLSFVYIRGIETLRRGKAMRAVSAHPVERLAEHVAAEVLRLLRKLADGEVRLLLAGASFTEGYTLNLHHRPTEAWTLRFASHLARARLGRHLGQENLPPKILRTRDLLLVIRTPLVSTPATNCARTLRKGISSLETGIAAVRQAHDGRPVSPRRRLLSCYLGRVGLSFHFRSFLLPWLLHQCQMIFLVFCTIYYNYILRRSRKQVHARLPSGSPDREYALPRVRASFSNV